MQCNIDNLVYVFLKNDSVKKFIILKQTKSLHENFFKMKIYGCGTIFFFFFDRNDRNGCGSGTIIRLMIGKLEKALDQLKSK